MAAVPIRVMIVDDTESLRNLLRARVERAGGMEVVGEAEDGLEAMSIARGVEPDAIILDVEMPVMDGIAALGGLREVVPGAKIILFSSRAEPSTRDEALAAGADAFFQKGETTSADVIEHIQGMFETPEG